jgi:hypothetical protein
MLSAAGIIDAIGALSNGSRAIEAEPDDYAWVMRRTTPTPLRAYMTALDFHAPVGNGLLKTTFIATSPRTLCWKGRGPWLNLGPVGIGSTLPVRTIR